MQMYLKKAATRTVQKEMAKKDTNAGTRMEEALMMGLERNQGATRRLEPRKRGKLI